jgi:L-lactate dehydrogenase complex protein LldE
MIIPMTGTRDYPQRPSKVYFFGTCLIDLFYPEAGLAGMQLLRRAGVETIYPQDQTCCGQPAWNAGYREAAAEVAWRQIQCFPEAYPVVVPSASCAGMMRCHYPELFPTHPGRQQALAFSERVFELTEFLVHVLQLRLTDLGAPERVALHTSCSARREIGANEEHKALLRQLRRVELIEPEHAEECCGFGGTFAVKHPEVSNAMVQDKADAILRSGAERLVSGDCGCLMNISGHMARRGDGIQSQHIASFLWERTSTPSR